MAVLGSRPPPPPHPCPIFSAGAPACVDTGSDQRHYPDLLEPFAEQKVLCMHVSLSSESQFKNKNINIFITRGFCCQEKEVLPLQRLPAESQVCESWAGKVTPREQRTEQPREVNKEETMLVRQWCGLESIRANYIRAPCAKLLLLQSNEIAGKTRTWTATGFQNTERLTNTVSLIAWLPVTWWVRNCQLRTLLSRGHTLAPTGHPSLWQLVTRPTVIL